MSTVLITGSNRGLGLEFVRQYATEGWKVIATARDPDDPGALAALARAHPNVQVEEFDALRDDSYTELARRVRGVPLDIVINNAGVMTRRGFGGSSWADWERHFRINSYAPMRLAESLVDALALGTHKKFVALTSLLGSIAANQSGGLYAYRASKAAANAVLKSLAVDLAPRGITVLAMHPGWVKTDLGGVLAPLDATTSVTGMRAVIAAATTADSGHFRQWDGAEIAW